jgi:glycosyltransferase involved in cell wall biosynthesis
MILGEGEERQPLEALARELRLDADVALPGFVSNPYAYMKRAAVFAASSRWEGFGNVLVEAMACGAPVVSTDCPSGPREILEGGRHGLLVPVGDAQALARAIEASLGRPPLPGARARADDFGIGAAVDRYAAVLGL